MDINNFKFKFITSIEEVGSTDWSLTVNTDYPFIQYEFLQALEASGCASKNSGWAPHHLVLTTKAESTVIAVVPLYIKTHSYGEYVFDFQWANAFHENGLNYYPKLLNAIPFTPCKGPRHAIKNSFEHLQTEIIQWIHQVIIDETIRLNGSSFHCLFPLENSQHHNHPQLMKRIGTQYHWSNDGYTSFDDFLAVCTMKKRKVINRERRLLNETGVVLTIVEGKAFDTALWSLFYSFYCSTYAKRSGNYGYLNLDFFERIGQSLAEQIMVVVVELNNEVIAMSLFFKSESTLYGRYWGCSKELEFLHFEACYYQGIEYCIKHGLQNFDAGAQGEHKIPRGFEPIETSSYHFIKEPHFEQAIKNFLNEESLQVKEMIHHLKKKLPFKKKE